MTLFHLPSASQPDGGTAGYSILGMKTILSFYGKGNFLTLRAWELERLLSMSPHPLKRCTFVQLTVTGRKNKKYESNL